MIEFDWQAGIGGAGHRLYRDNRYGVQLEIVTPKRAFGWGEGKPYYYIDGDSRTFTSEEDLSAALEEKIKCPHCQGFQLITSRGE